MAIEGGRAGVFFRGALAAHLSPHFAPPPRGLRVGVYTALGFEGVSTGAFTLADEDVWNRTVVWYDAATLEIGLQFNNDAPITAVLSGPIPAGSTQGLEFGEPSLPPVGDYDLSFDEIALWHNYVVTSGERDADWNSGAGTGWPDILSAVSKRPMAYWRFEEPEDYKPEGVESMV